MVSELMSPFAIPRRTDVVSEEHYVRNRIEQKRSNFAQPARDSDHETECTVVFQDVLDVQCMIWAAFSWARGVQMQVSRQWGG